MAIEFEGVLADRSMWRLDSCSISMSMDVIGTRSSMMVLREAFWGTTRFEDFTKRTKCTEAIVARRLKELTELGIFVRQPYQEPGKRTRDEYLLTDKGRGLLPAVFALMQWGNEHLQPEEGGPLRMIEKATGEPVTFGPRSASGASLDVDDLAIVANGDWPARQAG